MKISNLAVVGAVALSLAGCASGSREAGGTVIGASDKTGGYPSEDPQTPENFAQVKREFQTFYEQRLKEDGIIGSSFMFIHDNQVVARITAVTPTAFLNYKFGEASSKYRPFVGIGINYSHITATTTAIGDRFYAANGAAPSEAPVTRVRRSGLNAADLSDPSCTRGRLATTARLSAAVRVHTLKTRVPPSASNGTAASIIRVARAPRRSGAS